MMRIAIRLLHELIEYEEQAFFTLWERAYRVFFMANYCLLLSRLMIFSSALCVIIVVSEVNANDGFG